MLTLNALQVLFQVFPSILNHVWWFFRISGITIAGTPRYTCFWKPAYTKYNTRCSYNRQCSDFYLQSGDVFIFTKYGLSCSFWYSNVLQRYWFSWQSVTHSLQYLFIHYSAFKLYPTWKEWHTLFYDVMHTITYLI